MVGYSVENLGKGYQWLGHDKWTELVALHPDYKPGKQNYEFNLKNNTYPRIWYARDERDVVRFVEQHHKDRMVCYSLNDRPQIFKNDKGYARSAYENEIEVSRNLFIDIDFENKKPSKVQQQAFGKFLKESDSYFQDLGLGVPTRVYSGRGYHLLFAYPAIQVSEHPDISARLKKFSKDYGHDYRRDLENLEARVDSTNDLRRIVRCAGTAKPDVGIISEFQGGERIEDIALREYLLSMSIDEAQKLPIPQDSKVPVFGPQLINVHDELPPLFQNLLQRDEKLRNYWNGNGKVNGDGSRSGYDYSIARRIIALGYRNLDDLATVLFVRPEGAVRKSGKGEDYVRRTLSKAIHQ